MAAKDWFFSTLLLVLIFTSKDIIAQIESSTPEFFIGSYIAHYFPNTQVPDTLLQQMKDCGLNAVQQYARKDGYQNLDDFTGFSFVYASNDSAPIHAKNPANKDWISYFTHAKYYRWEAEGDQYFPADQDSVGIKHEFGHSTSEGWSSGTDTTQIGRKLIYGPNYTQYKYHVYTHRELESPLYYKASFKMKLSQVPEDSVDIARISIVIRNTETYKDTTLVCDTISSNQFSTMYKNFDLSYNYNSFQMEGLGNAPSYPSAIGSDWIPFGGERSASWIDGKLKVHFVVEWLGGAELIVDYIEVYDTEIWESYFILDPSSVSTKINTYLNEFQSINPTFYSKLKYFTTIDEPHSWDSYIPIREVQRILDSLESDKSLLVHFYPGWDNKRDGVDSVLEKWYHIAQPKKINFWYGPFTNDSTTLIPYPRSFTLYHLRNIMQKAHDLNPGFFTTPQAFSNYNTITGVDVEYMYPTQAELSAETMLGLAHGAKGFNYEMYFSYNAKPPYRSYGLVDLDENNFAPLPLWYKVRDLAGRLKGPFGQTLINLQYSGNYLMLRRHVEPSSVNTADSVRTDFLSLKTTSGMSFNFHAGLFQPGEESKYFLLINMLTDSLGTRSVNIGISDTQYVNIKVKNIEPEYNFDTTFTNNLSFNYNFPPGDGYLFQVAPVVKYGGKLLYNETISSTIDLTDNLVIYSNATLTVSGTYNIYDTLTINSGGHLVVTSGGKINVESGGAIINNGTISASGAEFKFSDGISLRNNGHLSASYCLFSTLSNNWGGIYFTSGSTGGIDHCTIEKSSGALITINNSSPEIRNSSLHDCVNGIYILNESESYIFSDSIYNFEVSGIYIENSSPYIASNIITGDQNHDPSIPIKCENYSTPYFSEQEEFAGRNTLQNGTTGIIANKYSSVYMGSDEETFHLNRIVNNSNYALADTASVIYAQLNWWGTDDPNKDLFLTGYESFIYFEPYLAEDPLEGFLMGGEDNYTYLDQQLIEAKGYVADSNYTAASDIYRTIINNYPDSAHSKIALIELKDIFRKTDDNTHLNFIIQITDSVRNHPIRKNAIESLSGIHLRKKNYPSAQAINNYLIQNYANTEYEKSGRRNKFYTHFAKKEFSDAKDELDVIKSKYEPDDQIQVMDWLLYLEGYNPQLLNKTEKQTAAAKTGGYKFSAQNYPNPFNPVTTIRFYIEQSGKVNLTIYDILGRRVKTLVDEIRDPGEYEVKFNASHLASGVYIYRLQSNEKVLTRKFILLK